MGELDIGPIIYFIVIFMLVIAGIWSFFLLLAYLYRRWFFWEDKEILAEMFKDVLLRDVEHGNRSGKLIIEEDKIYFKDKKDNSRNMVIPINQILSIEGVSAPYLFWGGVLHSNPFSIWLLKLWIKYRSSEGREEDVIFLFQNNAGPYYQKIKSEIEKKCQLSKNKN